MSQAEKRDQEKHEDNAKGFGKLIESTVTSSYDDLLAIIEARMELVKIEITEKIAIATSLLIIALVLFAGIVYLIATIALFIGELLGHAYLGYLAVSGFFLLLVLIFTKISPELLKNIIHKLLLSSNGKKS